MLKVIPSCVNKRNKTPLISKEGWQSLRLTGWLCSTLFSKKIDFFFNLIHVTWYKPKKKASRKSLRSSAHFFLLNFSDLFM